ncbi:Hypothetical protein SCF082_LOCUS9039 [Durusdinium trenchii]|uniref:Uncharacterized protein n=1 Tax=Durusdinium trenchii TaxID=1381693 RepID=A0ABP0IWN3_9DINO
MARAPEGLALIHGALYLFQSLASILVLTPSWLLGNCLTKDERQNGWFWSAVCRDGCWFGLKTVSLFPKKDDCGHDSAIQYRLIVAMYCCHEPIKAGLLVSMFWCGALFSAGTSGEFNTRLLYFWRDWDPACHAKSPLGPTWPYDDPSTSCVAKALVEWILTPGIVEESMKLLVLLRLVPSLEDAMRSLWLTRCPRMSTFQCLPCCGWFLKLAASPVVVVLCGMSVGAGFSTRENVSYIGRIKGQVESTRNLLPAVGRLIAAVLHISLTGTCAFFLAVSLFKGKAYRWAKYLGWALMVVAHGSFDAFLTFNQAVPLHECYFRATCDQTTRKCTIDKKGMLAGCRCSSGVDPETRRCKGRKANGNTSELTLSTDFTDLAKAEDFWELAADRRSSHHYHFHALGLLLSLRLGCATPRLERSFQSSAGSEELCHVISPKLHANISERSVAEVVGFIGLIMKERGDLLEACRLYQKSVLMASDHGSLCLNLMHTYSLRRDDLRAVAWGKRFMQKQQLFAPVLAALDGKSVSDDAKIFGVKDFAAENEFHDALAIGLVTFKLLFLAQPRGFESKGEPSWLKRLKTMEIESHIVGPGVLSLMEDTWRRRSEMDASMLVGAQKHNQVLKRLCGVLEKCCQGHDLHLTPVRNENAYFRCIKDILARESSEAVPKAPTNFKPMFVVGDSHVLSMAWQFVDFDDQHFILIPLLVTGVKLWHLREESKFFTVFSFWDKLQIIPIETPVMFLLGEIDCREGVLTTVQKGKYTSFDDALRTIVNVYLDVLVQVRRKLTSNRIFVHPVPSVLPETRFLTMAMNNLLDSDWSQNSMNKARVKLLKIQSIFDSPVPEDADITTLSKLQLLPDLRLDGIHLSPSYVKSHLAPAMQQAWS